MCGETAVPVNEFALTYKEMLKVDTQSNTSQLREEFQVRALALPSSLASVAALDPEANAAFKVLT